MTPEHENKAKWHKVRYAYLNNPNDWPFFVAEEIGLCKNEVADYFKRRRELSEQFAEQDRQKHDR